MKQVADTNSTFPMILTKNQSGYLFSKSNLQRSFDPMPTSTESPLEFNESLSSLKKFKKFLLDFYKSSGFDESKTQAALSQIEYLYQLLKVALDRGGWSCMCATHSWNLVSRRFGSMQAWRIRDDYESFLYILEKTHNPSTKYDQATIDNYLQDLNPGLLKSCDFFQPSVLVNEISASAMHRFLNIEAVLVPKMVNVMLDFDLSSLSLMKLKEKGVKLQLNENSLEIHELMIMESFYTEVPLMVLKEEYCELGRRIPTQLHWAGKDNLLRYTIETPGLSAPVLVSMKNTLSCIGGPSYMMLNGVYLNIEGTCEWFGISQQQIPLLIKKVQKDSGGDIFDAEWAPDEQYLLINNIEFSYTLTNPGDVFIAKTNIVYWIKCKLSTLVYWHILPKSRISECATSYFATKEAKHKFNLPLVAIELLNESCTSLDDETFTLLKKIFTESIDENNWSGTFTLETFDHRACSQCNCDLIWRYGRCESCFQQELPYILCLKCLQLHKCEGVVFLEKFSAVELDKFYQRLERRSEKDERQIELSKILVKPIESGAGECVKFNTEEYLIGNSEMELEQMKTERVKESEKERNVECEIVKAISIDECYRRKGKKKQKIREAMENPLSGPRFNYEFQIKNQNEICEVAKIDLPITGKPKANPLSSLITNKKDSALSSLISNGRKKELEQKKTMNKP